MKHKQPQNDDRILNIGKNEQNIAKIYCFNYKTAILSCVSALNGQIRLHSLCILPGGGQKFWGRSEKFLEVKGGFRKNFGHCKGACQYFLYHSKLPDASNYMDYSGLESFLYDH